MDAKLLNTKLTACARGDYSDFEGNSRVILAGGTKGLGGSKRIAVVHCHKREKEGNAYARMFVASPILYRALEKAVIHMENDEDGETFNNKLYMEMCAALKLATEGE